MSKKIGVTDSTAGAGVIELLSVESGLGTDIQAVDALPGGEEFFMAAFSASITPVLVSASVPFWDVAAMQVPAGKFLLVDSFAVENLTPDETIFRIAKRYVLAGNCAQAAPAAGSAPTVAAIAWGVGGLTGTYSYKLAQVNALNQQGALSTVSANISPSAQAVNLTVPALATGAVAYRIYRSLAGAPGGPWYWADDAIAGTYTDTMPDSDLTGPMRGSVQHPGVTWGNAFTGEVAPTAVEMVYLNVGVALASAPTKIAYISSKGVSQVSAFAPAVTINTTIRISTANEGRAFATPTPTTFMLSRDELGDYGAMQVVGFDKSYATMGGQWVIYGYAVHGTTPLEGTQAAGRLAHKQIKPILFHAGETVVGQIGNLAAAIAGVRKVEIGGRMFDIPT